VEDLRKRVLVGVCIGPFIALLFFLLPPWWFFLLLVLISILAVNELVAMSGMREKYLILFLVAVCLVPLYQHAFHAYLLWLLTGPAVFMIAKFIRGEAKNESVNREILAGIGVLISGELFVALPLFYLYLLREMGTYLPLILLFTMWASDTCAYLFGKTFGKRPLVPQVSPKKTYEGLLGAVVGSMLVISISAKVMGISMAEALLAGAVIGILAQTGDILESAAKRVFAVKDSSSLIPGHGGILDRIDSFIFTAPFLYHYLAGIRA
jgi:phosphatidate cytidylyltransferase